VISRRLLHQACRRMPTKFSGPGVVSWTPYGRHVYASGALGDYAAHPVQGHEAGDSAASHLARERFSISLAALEPSWTARLGSAALSRCGVHTWLLLARTQLQRRSTAEEQPFVLESKARSQSEARCPRRRKAHCSWLEAHRRLGMRVERSWCPRIALAGGNC
jgi:hypothetical protein